GFNLDAAHLALPSLNILHNTPGKSDFYTLEFSANKRLSNGWSLNGSFSYRWNYDNSNSYFGQNLRQRQDLANPNDAINTDDGRYVFNTWAFKIHGTYDAPWGLRITPALRMQAGQPFGRTMLAALNYGTQRILTEPISTRRQDNIVVLDGRFEKVFKVAANRSVSAFADVYNITNSNAASNINWGSGSTYLLPTTIIGPRILRIGAKFDW
ncbi:MAG: hypothetical protein HY655_08375, partial [Acidobacteria bacterium]|nr:hypothetical protein [Acidobacteriota bacterium]